MRSENLNTIAKLLSDFNNFIEKRSIVSLIIIGELFQKILHWHYEIWKKQFEYLSKENKTDELIIHGEIWRVLDSIFRKIEERSLKERKSFLFFKILKEHAKKYEKEIVKSSENQEHYYTEDLFSTFYDKFFGIIENSPEKNQIWKTFFPQEWKITKRNLESKDNIIAKLSLNIFLNWARERILETNEQHDKDLDNIFMNLFPEVDPILWAPLLIFAIMPDGGDRVKDAVELPWTFGNSHRAGLAFSYPVANREESIKEIKRIFEEEGNKKKINTFELAFFLFKQDFSVDNLNAYIHLLKELKDQVGSIEEHKRLRLLNTFNQMLDFLQNSESGSDQKEKSGN